MTTYVLRLLRDLCIKPMPHLQRKMFGRPTGNEPGRGGSGAISCPATPPAAVAPAPKAAPKRPLPATKFRRH
jgi:hypothetical protein